MSSSRYSKRAWRNWKSIRNNKSLCVWNALTKALERDRSISDIVMNAKSPSQAWIILTSIVEDLTSIHVKENAEIKFESLSMIVGESAREHVAKAKGLARAVEYHGIDVTEEKICCRFLNDLPSSMHFVRELFILNYDVSLVEVEQALVNVEALHKRRDGADEHALAAGLKRN